MSTWQNFRGCALAVLYLASCRRSSAPAEPLELASARGVKFDIREERPPPGYDPLSLANASVGKIGNVEAPLPPMCYTRTDGTANPCWACHTRSSFPNLADDWELQQNYPFTDTTKVNHWTNLFRDRTARVARFSDDDVLAYIRRDNYAPLRAALAARSDFTDWVPDVDLARGFDADGFASDGSGWRAIRYKPFLGTFWPTNGSTDDVFIRLPEDYRRDTGGTASRAIYQTNLAILEAAVASDPRRSDADLIRTIEPIDERASGIDLDRDGQLGIATTIAGLPEMFAGGAQGIRVVRAQYPGGVEFMHTVRYVDPDQPGLASRRIKELRYSRKLRALSRDEIADAFAAAETPDPPPFEGEPRTGLRNGLGWQLQGWIEDARGWLRLQTHEEHLSCMGCHSNLGVTVDQTFAFPRKVPGRDGWRPQDPRRIPDAPQVGHTEPEYAEYLERVGGGDELRANDEVLMRFFPEGTLDRSRLTAVRADIAELIFPSRPRAIALDRAYLANVIEQSYVWGRDAVIAPVANAHRSIVERSTGLGERHRTYRDGRLHLDW